MENQYLKKIIAQTPEDLHIISACCSEGKVNIDDIKYLASNKIFLISIARFSKEEENKNKFATKQQYHLSPCEFVRITFMVALLLTLTRHACLLGKK